MILFLWFGLRVIDFIYLSAGSLARYAPASNPSSGRSKFFFSKFLVFDLLDGDLSPDSSTIIVAGLTKFSALYCAISLSDSGFDYIWSVMVVSAMLGSCWSYLCYASSNCLLRRFSFCISRLTFLSSTDVKASETVSISKGKYMSWFVEILTLNCSRWARIRFWLILALF